MTPTPILDAESILRYAINGALSPLMSAYLDTAGRAKLYYKQADPEDANRAQVNPPFLIFQPQSDIQPIRWIDSINAEALITLRSHAPTQGAAETLLGVAAPGMGSLASPGYTFAARYERSPSIPPSENVWTAAHVFRISLSRV